MAKAAEKYEYKRIDPELMGEITHCVIGCLREEENRIIKERSDRKRSNVKLLLRKYREIVAHVDESVCEATHVSEDQLLQELFAEMSDNKRDTFRIESIRDSAAKSKVMVDHMNKMIESYRISCENSNRDEEKRRYRVLYWMYISPDPKTPDEIADAEFTDKSTIYRDIDSAADRLAVLLFGVYGLKFM